MQNRDSDRRRMFSRRAAILTGGKFALLSALVGRMYYLQVVESDRFQMLAEENRINMRLLAPSRGQIVDRFGVPLAINQQNYQVLVKSENTPDIGATLDRLGQLIPLSADERARILAEVSRKRKFVPVLVREFLDWEDVARIEVNAPDLPGVIIDVGDRRFYPQGEVASHILGYVGAPAAKHQTGDPLLELPGFRIGRSGVERTFDLALRGRAGSSQLEVNALGRVIRELGRREGQTGQTLVLTFDSVLQQSAMKALGDQTGSVVVLDVNTGATMVQASTPSFDPNTFTNGLSETEWRALADDERAPLRNKAIAGEYAPGSTFKMIVALAALKSGVINSDTSFFCSGSLTLGDGKFHCWKRQGHGHTNLSKGITQSCDVYFYELSRRVGIDRIAEMAKRFGLGQPLDLDIPGSRPGLIPTKAWKRAIIGQPWVLGETLVSGIGQGFVLATPLQLATMTARLANGGKAVTPFIARDVMDHDALTGRPEVAPPDIGVNPGHLDLVVKAMGRVTNSRRGTAYRARIMVPGMAMAGKTGTSQVRRISRAERAAGILRNDQLPWKRRDHALFVGFAPVEAPRYAVAVVVEHGGGGSSVAAPIARDMMIETLKRDPAGQAPGADVAGARPADGKV
ncbi:MAG: penicillin-binding protein 2 [Alphaproteobacteria bacterium]|nr:penicillin-binding protein 2 [Alphaproteobacteria bacterium]